MKKIVLLSILSIILFSCGEKKPTENSSVTGNITNLAEGSKVYLDYLTPAKIFTKDSATIDDEGNYSFNYQIESLGYYRLRINNQNFINLILTTGEKPTINGDGNDLMDTYTIEGSPQSSQLKEFNLAIKADFMLQDSLNKVYQANKNDPQLFVEIQKASIMSENRLKVYYMNLIDKNPGSLISLAAVQQLDPKVYAEEFKKVDEALAETMPETPYYRVFHQKVESMKELFVGDMAPDFSMPDMYGNTLSLSSLRGKVVLVDFWASWCKPCRAENPNVVKAYNEYHQKGFDVLSVSLDGMPQQQNPKKAWLNAIQKDGLAWENHVSELKGWESSVVGLYGIEAIPFTLLVDKDGKIVGKNLRGQDLEKKLAQLFE